MKQGLVPAAAADQQSDLAVGQIGADQDVLARDPLDQPIIGQGQPVQHLGYHIAGIVQQLLGAWVMSNVLFKDWFLGDVIEYQEQNHTDHENWETHCE